MTPPALAYATPQQRASEYSGLVYMVLTLNESRRIIPDGNSSKRLRKVRAKTIEKQSHLTVEPPDLRAMEVKMRESGSAEDRYRRSRKFR